MKPFIPLSVPHLIGNELKYLAECIKTGWVSTAGGFVTRLEREIAAFTGSPHAVATNSGTAALHIALKVLGIGPGDEVLVPTLTFIAPVNAVRYVGAEPVFMDCDDYLNIDSAKVREFCESECEFDGRTLVNRQSRRAVRAVVPVHIFGHPVDIGPLMEVAERYNLYVIEDASESIGSRYVSGKFGGRHTGSIGHIGCFSFNGNKIITSGGGGMLVTANREWASHALHLTTQAKADELYYVHDEVGYNYRMANVEAAIGVAQLERIESFVDIKRKNHELYKGLLADVPGVGLIEEPPYGRSNYWLSSLLVDSAATSRDRLLQALKSEGIQCRPIWKLNHLQRPYEGALSYMIEKAPDYYERVLSLPSSIGIGEGDIERVCKVISEEAR